MSDSTDQLQKAGDNSTNAQAGRDLNTAGRDNITTTYNFYGITPKILSYVVVGLVVILLVILLAIAGWSSYQSYTTTETPWWYSVQSSDFAEFVINRELKFRTRLIDDPSNVANRPAVDAVNSEIADQLKKGGGRIQWRGTIEVVKPNEKYISLKLDQESKRRIATALGRDAGEIDKRVTVTCSFSAASFDATLTQGRPVHIDGRLSMFKFKSIIVDKCRVIK